MFLSCALGPELAREVHHREKMEKITGDKWHKPLEEKNVSLVTRWHEDMCTSSRALAKGIF